MNRTTAATKIQQSVRSYLNKVSWHPIRVHTGRNADFQNAIRNRTVGKAIGDIITAYGTVHEIGTSLKYVVKRMRIRDANSRKIFFNEIRVGSMPGIQKVGPRIYAWRIKDGYGEYIMDNFVRGTRGLTVKYLSDYMKKHYSKTCPPKSNPIWGRLRTLLKNFWIITKGYHGDLHMFNIAVIQKGDSIVRLVIFDYGSHKKFKAPVNTSMCFDDLVTLVQTEFHRSNQKSTYELDRFPHNTEIKMYRPRTGQPRRSNASMMSGVNWKGDSIRNNSFHKSPMAHMRTKPRNIIGEIQHRRPEKTRANIREVLREAIEKNNSLHRVYFMSKENMKKAVESGA
jgi:hypothetical protein